MILPPERTASIACNSVRLPARPCLALPPAHSKTTSAPIPPVRSESWPRRRTLWRSERGRPPARLRHRAGLVANVNGNDQSGAADAGDLHALQAHAALAQDDHAYRRSGAAAVSTAATLSLSDCRQAATLSEMRSSTLTSAMPGNRARSEKQPGRSNPMTGPVRQSSAAPGIAERAVLARAAWPGRRRDRRADNGSLPRRLRRSGHRTRGRKAGPAPRSPAGA